MGHRVLTEEGLAVEFFNWLMGEVAIGGFPWLTDGGVATEESIS